MAKRVVLCFDSAEAEEVNAFIRRMRTVEENKGLDGDALDIEVIYPCDISENQYMSWKGTEPTEHDKKILNSLTPEDKIYVWGHGAPNYASMPGAVYTELADYLEKSINKVNFAPGKGSLNITMEICNGGRGGEQGRDSYAARLHSLLGKKGIHATVTGRLRNVIIDVNRIQRDGITTMERSKWALVEAGLYEADTFYERMAVRSKVSYQWDRNDPSVQVRVDSYRRSALIGFLKIKEQILDKVNSERFPLMSPRHLHQLLLTIEFNLSQDRKQFDVDLVKKTTQELGEYCHQIGISKKELERYGFNYFQESLGNKVTKDGFLRIKTGIKCTDPLLDIEKRPIVDVINEHPPFQELNRIIVDFKNTKDVTEDIEQLIKIIGTKEDWQEANLYTDLVTIARSYNLVNNNGKLDIPDYVDVTTQIINKVLNLAYKSDLDPAQKLKEIANIKKQLTPYRNADYEFRLMSSLNNEAPAQEHILYFEQSSKNIFNYKILVDGEVLEGKIDIKTLPNLTVAQQKKIEGGSLDALNAVKDQILDSTAEKGHTKKELTFWGKICIALSALVSGLKNTWGERHEASMLEFIDNLFYQPYESIKDHITEHTNNINQINAVIKICENKIRLQKQHHQSPTEQSLASDSSVAETSDPLVVETLELDSLDPLEADELEFEPTEENNSLKKTFMK
ncbi:hypothetical protein [Legionella quateirensis]|uniref:Uncharacterized protein n=1 Tax=Legionella quateirensis TaxID=45072 RepID=A0A378KTL6_9GAMM|nr:hypothetical protein [Legionella quateirensis]KTD50852.1 hypothetical protein Lqua_1079 [Legionella quateirensis]STY17902.1 Uncharacterised protein [Legionella quateirensis]